jgi:hypothetical protein
MATRLATQLVLAALNMALITRGPKVRSTIKTGDCKVDSIDRCNTIFVDLSGPHRGLTPVLDESLPSPEAHDSAPPVFDKCRRPNLYKHSAVLGLVHYEPALRAGTASGRSAERWSAPRNGPLEPTGECDVLTLDPDGRVRKPRSHPSSVRDAD